MKRKRGSDGKGDEGVGVVATVRDEKKGVGVVAKAMNA
jgi:hypothetical protein